MLSQWAQEPTLITVTFVLFAAGSLAPLFKNADKGQSLGPFTPAAELINGRAAMCAPAFLHTCRGCILDLVHPPYPYLDLTTPDNLLCMTAASVSAPPPSTGRTANPRQSLECCSVHLPAFSFLDAASDFRHSWKYLLCLRLCSAPCMEAIAAHEQRVEILQCHVQDWICCSHWHRGAEGICALLRVCTPV